MLEMDGTYAGWRGICGVPPEAQLGGLGTDGPTIQTPDGSLFPVRKYFRTCAERTEHLEHQLPDLCNLIL